MYLYRHYFGLPFVSQWATQGGGYSVVAIMWVNMDVGTPRYRVQQSLLLWVPKYIQINPAFGWDSLVGELSHLFAVLLWLCPFFFTLNAARFMCAPIIYSYAITCCNFVTTDNLWLLDIRVYKVVVIRIYGLLTWKSFFVNSFFFYFHQTLLILHFGWLAWIV